MGVGNGVRARRRGEVEGRAEGQGGQGVDDGQRHGRRERRESEDDACVHVEGSLACDGVRCVVLAAPRGGRAGAEGQGSIQLVRLRPARAGRPRCWAGPQRQAESDLGETGRNWAKLFRSDLITQTPNCGDLFEI